MAVLPDKLRKKVINGNFYTGFAQNYYKYHYADMETWLKKFKVNLQTGETPILYLNMKGAGKENLLCLGFILTNKRILSKSDPISGIVNPSYMTGQKEIFYKDIQEIKTKKAWGYKSLYMITFHHYIMKGTVRELKKSYISFNYPEQDYIPLDELLKIFWLAYKY